MARTGDPLGTLAAILACRAAVQSEPAGTAPTRLDLRLRLRTIDISGDRGTSCTLAAALSAGDGGTRGAIRGGSIVLDDQSARLRAPPRSGGSREGSSPSLPAPNRQRIRGHVLACPLAERPALPVEPSPSPSMCSRGRGLLVVNSRRDRVHPPHATDRHPADAPFPLRGGSPVAPREGGFSGLAARRARLAWHGGPRGQRGATAPGLVHRLDKAHASS